MALFRIPLSGRKNIEFFKLMGCGKNGSFDIHPDWNQWAVLIFTKNLPDLKTGSDTLTDLHLILYGPFITWWWKKFHCESWTIFLELIEGYGSWDGKKFTPAITEKKIIEGPLAVLTRATIRLRKLPEFWKNVAPVSNQMNHAKGLITSIGIGEMPLVKQATFSIWESTEAMKNFAYAMQVHREVIKKTRKENWYSEDMFLRFRPLLTIGTLKGINPFPM